MQKAHYIGIWVHIQNTLIFRNLMNEPNKLECYIKIGQKGLSVRNTLAYWVHS